MTLEVKVKTLLESEHIFFFSKLQEYVVSSGFILLCSMVLLFLQPEGNTLHQQKDCDLLYSTVALLGEAGTRPAIWLRYACRKGHGYVDKYDRVLTAIANICVTVFQVRGIVLMTAM